MKLGLFGLALIISLGSTVSVADSRDLAGHYYLQGVMEMASELVLRKDGTFSSGIMYGRAVAEAECNTVIDLKLEHDAA